MKTFLTVFLLFSLCQNYLATAQYPDKIIYKGEEYSLHSNPMEAYFEIFPDKRPAGGIVSTALWRGYIATFEMKDDQLYVTDIQIMFQDTTNEESFKYSWCSVMEEVFPAQTKVKVDWLSGLLVIPYGKLIHYVHMGYGSTFKNYILLEIDKGNLKKEMKFRYKEYEKFKEKQFQAFKETDEYRKIKAELQERGDSEEFIDSFLKSYIVKYTSRILVE